MPREEVRASFRQASEGALLPSAPNEVAGGADDSVVADPPLANRESCLLRSHVACFALICKAGFYLLLIRRGHELQAGQQLPTGLEEEDDTEVWNSLRFDLILIGVIHVYIYIC
ncbi:hypothetical protein CDAR_47121 [Caerostris darwini]|uniref:Uncharacterized protein n=1 Tax=Caerostris darwini TaxID=1538125 RepID=A0AAV4UA99_9ARAC|nr:hypothetical protein CDAR_47121 [Caerostris darwini]